MYLVRHGATANNEDRPPRLQGRRTDEPLSQRGRRQAGQTAGLLAGCGLAAVFSSPLLRARETAGAIAAAAGLPVAVVDELTEVDVGRWEGRTWEEVQQTDPEAYRAFLHDPGVHPYLGGESFRSVLDRVRPAFERLAAEHLGRAIAVVAHNVVNRCYLAPLLRLPLAQYRAIPQENCGVSVVRYRGGEAKVVTLNAVLHLDGP